MNRARKSLGEWPDYISPIIKLIRNRYSMAPARFWKMRGGWSIWL